MPKPPNPKCELCAGLPVAQARVIHGADGDGCWDAKYCYNRRSFYRHRLASTAALEIVQVPPPESLFAVLFLYKEPGDKPLHALGAELWKGQKPICRLEPIHCFGLTAGKIRAYSDQVLKAFSEQYGTVLHQYKEMFEISPSHCPVQGDCPLRRQRTL
jgi:hypothetical protein